MGSEMDVEVVIIDSKSAKTLTTLKNLNPKSTVYDVKREFQKTNHLYPGRQCFRKHSRGKILENQETLENLGITKKGILYFKDLGPQVGWTTVFMTEYTGPLVIYLFFYIRPSFVYGALAATVPRPAVVNIAAGCWTLHYVKRLLETQFVHRFSHATMPISNIFKNSIYYWGFAAFISYFINHPLYMVPVYGNVQVYGGLAAFLINELGNLAIHLHFRNMRPSGSKIRQIPYPGKNPFTWLFRFVSCPNYTYEFYLWLSFSVMTQSLPALLFTSAGFYQMSVWALAKHRNYKREFKNYPKGRKSIIPFVL